MAKKEKNESPSSPEAPTKADKEAQAEPSFFDRNKPFLQHNGPDYSYVEQGGVFYSPITRKELTPEEKAKLVIKK